MREITIACNTYDRTVPLLLGQVSVDGAPYRCVSLHPSSEIFYRMLKYEDFDVAEMSLSSYASALSRGDDRFVGLPVFLSRAFRHANLFVREDDGIDDPSQLVGARIGTYEYQMTAGVWIRGLLQDEHGVRAQDVSWVTRREEKLADVPLDPRVSVTHRPELELEHGLLSGELDALAYTARPVRLGDGIRRLFVDHRAAEQEYYRRTRIFPVMHMVVMKRTLYEDHPWLARSLYKAFERARKIAMDRLYHRAHALPCMVPWLMPAIEEGFDVCDGNPWTYGLEDNRHVIDAFARYLVEQGLTVNALQPSDLFVDVRTTNHLEPH